MIGYEGWQFNQYFLDQLIDRGGFADIYKAWDTSLERWVAIKLPRKRLSANEQQKFLREAQLMANLQHPHIMTIFAFDCVEVPHVKGYRTIPYFVMSYAPHGSLADRYPYGEILSMKLILEYMEQIVDALEYIHSNLPGNHSLIHLDIKPANILLGINNEILLTDFGIARVVQNAQSSVILASGEDWVGTVMYMAPERFDGLASPATDQYALGIILYSWFTGRYPFYGMKREIIQQQIYTPPPSLRSIVPDLSPAIEHVVLKALSKNPDARFNSVRELFLALEEARHSSFSHSLLAFFKRS